MAIPQHITPSPLLLCSPSAVRNSPRSRVLATLPMYCAASLLGIQTPLRHHKSYESTSKASLLLVAAGC